MAKWGGWYVLAAMGIFPLCPGSGEYVLNTPLFAEVNLTLPGAKKLRILSQPNCTSSQQQILWNNTPLSALKIRHEELVEGGELQFQMESIQK